MQIFSKCDAGSLMSDDEHMHISNVKHKGCWHSLVDANISALVWSHYQLEDYLAHGLM